MDGILIINKPENYTSHDIVQKVKKILNTKVGHTGTLDPMATGVLPLLIGSGTLISKYLINHDKIYIAKVKLGIQTDTGDSEGKIIKEQEVNKLEEKQVITVLNSFIGKNEQKPPMYSAIKYNGKKLYEYARKGIEIEVSPRQIEIYNIELIKMDNHNAEIEFKVSCSKGTYIRSLCEDIAIKLGTVGYMKQLNREKVGEFDISEAIKINEIEDIQLINDKIISIEQYFKNKEQIILNQNKLQLFLNGVQLTYNLLDDIYRIYDSYDRFIGIGRINNKLLKRDVITRS